MEELVFDDHFIFLEILGALVSVSVGNEVASRLDGSEFGVGVGGGRVEVLGLEFHLIANYKSSSNKRRPPEGK